MNQSRRRRVLLSVSAAAAILCAVGLVVLSSRVPDVAEGNPGAPVTGNELARIGTTVEDYKSGCAGGYVIPMSSIDAVVERQSEVLKARSAPVVYGEKHDEILTPQLREHLDSEYMLALKKYCDASYGSVLGSCDIGEETDLSLYNNPSLAPLVASDFKVMSVCYKGTYEGDVIVWVPLWNADLDERGVVRESWSLREYRMVLSAGEWKIKGETSLWHWDDAAPDENGAGSPHEDWSNGEQLGGSILHQGSEVSTSEVVEAMKSGEAAE